MITRLVLALVALGALAACEDLGDMLGASRDPIEFGAGDGVEL